PRYEERLLVVEQLLVVVDVRVAAFADHPGRAVKREVVHRNDLPHRVRLPVAEGQAAEPGAPNEDPGDQTEPHTLAEPTGRRVVGHGHGRSTSRTSDSGTPSTNS